MWEVRSRGVIPRFLAWAAGYMEVPFVKLLRAVSFEAEVNEFSVWTCSISSNCYFSCIEFGFFMAL